MPISVRDAEPVGSGRGTAVLDDRPVPGTSNAIVVRSRSSRPRSGSHIPVLSEVRPGAHQQHRADLAIEAAERGRRPPERFVLQARSVVGGGEHAPQDAGPTVRAASGTGRDVFGYDGSSTPTTRSQVTQGAGASSISPGLQHAVV